MRALLLAAVVALVLAPAASAQAKAYTDGYYSGRTSQGTRITFVAAGGHVSEFFTQVTDSCNPGKWYVSEYPNASRLGSDGKWSYVISGSEPTDFNAVLNGFHASGTIDDVSLNSKHRRCHGHVRFRAQHQSPLRIRSANVGRNGADVVIGLDVASSSTGYGYLPYTNLSLLLYASNSTCSGGYRSAAAQARKGRSHGVAASFLDEDVVSTYVNSARAGYRHGTFTYDITGFGMRLTRAGKSPFARVCALLYYGQHAENLSKSHNATVALASAPLPPGRGIPQP